MRLVTPQRIVRFKLGKGQLLASSVPSPSETPRLGSSMHQKRPRQKSTLAMATFFRDATIYRAPLQPKILRIDNNNVPESARRAVPQLHMCAALSTHTIAIIAWQRALNCSCYSDPAMGDRAAFGEYSRPCIETQDARRRSDDLAHVSGRPAHVDRSSPQGLEAS